jgi:hypothetical protein
MHDDDEPKNKNNNNCNNNNKIKNNYSNADLCPYKGQTVLPHHNRKRVHVVYRGPKPKIISKDEIDDDDDDDDEVTLQHSLLSSFYSLHLLPFIQIIDALDSRHNFSTVLHV